MAQHSLAEIIAGHAPDQTARVSPGGRYALVLSASEVSNSQWVESGTLFRVAGEAMLAQLGEWTWTVDTAEWHGDEALVVSMRRYPGDAPSLVLRLAIAEATATPEPAGESVAFAALNDWLESWYAAHRSPR